MFSKQNRLKQRKIDLVLWVVFLTTLGVVFVAVTTIVFPALVIRTMGGFTDYTGINPFEVGIWAIPFFITNFIILAIAILYFTNALPKLITKSIQFIFKFEVSLPISILVITGLVGFYIVFTAPELLTEEKWPDYLRIKPFLEKLTISDVTKSSDLGVQLFLLYSSKTIFNNYKVIPFVTSIALLVLTYFITKEITQKRFAGIVSMAIVLQSGTFLIYDTSVVYTNFWVLFYLISLYVIVKAWPVSPISFVLSFFSKGLTALFVPMSFFFIYRANISRKKKILLAASYSTIIIIGLTFFSTSLPAPTPFNSHDFWKAFNAISYQLRWDGLVLMFLLPLTIGLFMASRKKILHSDSIMVLITGVILSQPITAAFSTPSSEPYRFMPLVVFFAIGIGTLLSSRFNPKA